MEEDAYGWTISQYPQRKKIHDKLTPFLRLYETGTDFLNQYDQWLHGPLSGVNPDKVPESSGCIFNLQQFNNEQGHLLYSGQHQ